MARIEAELAGVPLDTPDYLRRFIVELVLLQPLSRANRKLLAGAFKNKQLSADEQVQIDSMLFRAGRTHPAIVSFIFMGGFVSIGVVASQFIGSVIQDRYHLWWIGYSLIIIIGAINHIINLLYRRTLKRSLSKSLQHSGLVELISAGSDELLRIYNHAKEPWRTVFLGIRPRTLRESVRFLAANLSWYLNPPCDFIPLGWLPRVLTGLPGILALLYIFVQISRPGWAAFSSTVPNTSYTGFIPLNWQYTALCVTAIILLLPATLILSHDKIVKKELLDYLRTRLIVPSSNA